MIDAFINTFKEQNLVRAQKEQAREARVLERATRRSPRESQKPRNSIAKTAFSVLSLAIMRARRVRILKEKRLCRAETAVAFS